MKMTKLGKALFAALSAASPVLAADSALPALVGNANRKTFNRDEIKGKLIALDAELDPQQLDNVIDALLDVEQEPKPVELQKPAEDEDDNGAPSKHAEIIDFLRSKGLPDADLEAIGNMLTRMDRPEGEDEASMKPEYVKAAMDGLRAELRDANIAAREVRDVVGDVAMDSAAEIYGFALDHMKVDRTGVDSPAALRALFKVASAKSAAPAPAVAQDSAGLVKQFPGVARFRIA